MQKYSNIKAFKKNNHIFSEKSEKIWKIKKMILNLHRKTRRGEPKIKHFGKKRFSSSVG